MKMKKEDRVIEIRNINGDVTITKKVRYEIANGIYNILLDLEER